MDFCAIAPTKLLHHVEGRRRHLTLAHLVERDEEYVQFYIDEKANYGSHIIMDNSAFELVNEGRALYDAKQLIELAKYINADEVVLVDVPYKHHQSSIDNVYKDYAAFRNALPNVKLMYVPQSKKGDIDGLVNAFRAGIHMRKNGVIDRIGVSILAVPNAYGLDKNSPRVELFTARYNFLHHLRYKGIFSSENITWKIFHMLGLIDGPKEIRLLNQFSQYIQSWDSSSPVWAGVHHMMYDQTATGLVDGKIQTPVDFNFNYDNTIAQHACDATIKYNINYIDTMISSYY